MTPIEILDIWAKTCDKLGVKWYIYKATLLLAECYGNFPKELTDVQVAIEAENLSGITPHLPAEWQKKRGRYYLDNKLLITVTCNTEPQNECTYIECNGISYPAMVNYKEYLTEKYGDYEHGKDDEIGFGLTAEQREELKLHQQNCIEALAFLEEMRKKYSLKYYLVAGSVLGAVRHKGFIPWDDDIDIGVKVEEIEEFERIIKEHLPKKFSLKQAAPHDPYNRMFSKICVDGRCCIDIWRLCPTKKEGLLAKFKWFAGRMMTKCHYVHLKAYVGSYEKYAKILCIFLSDKAVMKLARFIERCCKRKADSYINLYSIYSRSKETIAINWLETEATEEFAGMQVPVIGCTDEYLKHLYGDYMAVPPRWTRVNNHYCRF